MRGTTSIIVFSVAALLAAGHDSLAQRRGGFAGGRAGGAVVGPQGGSGVGTRSGGTVVGPAGGTRSYGSGSGSYTTQRGTTIDYAGAGRGGTTPGGVSAGRGVGGVQVTTPGGRTATKVGTAGGISGPGGNAVGGRRGYTTAVGPGGSFSSAYRGGVAIGPYGAAAGGTRVATGRGAYGTYYASRSTLATTGGVVRSSFGYYNTFSPAWYARYPGAWFAAGWTTARIWSAPAWSSVATFCSYPAQPVYYDYGETVVYSDNTVVINADTQVTAEQYAQQATDIAGAGKVAAVEPKGDDFQPLGVFAMIQEGEEKSTNLFQLAVNKDGVLRGNYYNALTDTTEPIYGSVNKPTQRAAWTVGDRKTPVYEVGIANLTRDETTMLVHFGKDQPPRQFTLVRIQQPEGKPIPGGK